MITIAQIAFKNALTKNLGFSSPRQPVVRTSYAPFASDGNANALRGSGGLAPLPAVRTSKG
jgi:hypothetical protein